MLMPPPLPPGSSDRYEPSSTIYTSIIMSDATSVGTSRASSLKSSAFSESTKLRVRQIDGDECWACGTEPPHICHVAQEDRQASLWVELGLIDFPLTSVLNAIPLCPSCHDQFDCLNDPGFVFIPKDLQFFIEYELKDRERRKIAAEKGVILKRETPTSEQYKIYQVSKGIITVDAIGGQYLPVFLKSYLHRRRFDFNIAQVLSKPREWHGAPLACLRRCIQALGSPRLGIVNRDSCLKLRQLYDLYFFDDEYSPSCNKLPDLAVRSEPIDSGKKRQFDGITPGDPHSAKRHQGSRERENNSSQDTTTFCPILLREVRAVWSLGPDVSTEEAVRQFAPIVTRSLNSSHV
ncbi:uncharacterized protein BDW43DRAFT_242985 [Aspergillus alliaceus]|uniref:uncharacterized protein n=1 Tax=Petromyces alliaceus TaxID=209559 RepID=UPI0012A68596|nr:uncharacterized protein BDW43DRAFT_242985 [Aspergillus alliaceus]KAB8227564.1 hypothetical protein BDW43DRAFT_242985 [Aspergillus alliaceus]